MNGSTPQNKEQMVAALKASIAIQARKTRNPLSTAVSLPLPVEVDGVTIRTAHVECGCSRRYTRSTFVNLEPKGLQKLEGGGAILLANCRCGSTIAMEVA